MESECVSVSSTEPEVPLKDPQLDDKSDKADSGMDEDSQPFKDEDEDEIVICKPKTKRAIIDDDEDESSKDSLPDKEDKTESQPKLKTAGEVLDAVLNEESDQEDSSSDEDDKETLLSTLKKKKKKIRTNITSDSEDEENSSKEKPESVLNHSASQTIFANSDLFDAEEDDDRKSRDSGEETASDSNHEGDDEGFDETSIDPQLLKKLKKGASKKASKPWKQVEKEEKLQLHSETQRLIRESRVNLPYHQPEPKKLQDFLARATNKQQQYGSLRGARDLTKAKAMEQILTMSKPKVTENKKTSEKSSEKTEPVSSDLNNSHSGKDGPEPMEDDCDSLPDLDSHVTKETNHVINDEMDEDSLPDLASRVLTEETKGIKETSDIVNDKTTDEKTNVDDNVKENSDKSDCDTMNNETTKDDRGSVELDGENKENIDSSEHEKDKSKLISKKLSILSELPSLPKLNLCSGGSYIDLEVNNVEARNPGVNKLMDRFMEHSKKKHKHPAKDVELSVVQKEKTDNETDELKLNKFVYHVTEEEEDSMSQFETPGAKLVALKEKLKQKMKVKREEIRKQKQEVFDLDNEEGYEEDKLLDDGDDEMTDKSDTDVEDDDFDEEFGEEEEEEEEKEEDKVENPFCDDEAEEDNDDDDNEFRLHLSDSDEVGDGDKENGDEEEDIVRKKPSSGKKKPKVLDISDDEESKMSAAKSQTEEEGDQNSVTDDKEDNDGSFTLFSKHLSGEDITQTKKTPLKPDDSQDNNADYYEESQMLDADGFLKSGSERKTQKRSSPSFKDLLPTDDNSNMDELLGLCSGRFTNDDDEKKTSCKSLFGTQAPESTQGNMEEFLGLCSGKFVANTQATQPSLKRKANFDEESNTSIQMASDNEEDFKSTDKRGFSDNEDDTNSVASEDISQPFKSFVSGKTGKIRKEFVDEEAELSGSEYDSDENLDLAEEDDIMEAELGDNDVTATEEELRDQVGRVHLKQLIDEDKRELLRYQEMYLPDGDLHSDAGRTRRFKWNNIDDDTQQDMFDDKSDEEKEEEEGEEAKWRQDRYEREKWLQEQQENEKNNDDDENSQFVKLGKVFLKRQDSDSSLLKKPEVVPVQQSKKPSLPVPKLSRRGSFLSRDKDQLAKIASMTKPVVNPSGARNSGKFVFHVISPEKDSQIMPAPAEPKVQKATSKQPPAKKPRLERSSSFSQSSIFNHL